jgi:hypothetical protein
VSASGKATAFIGTPPEMFYTHSFPPCRPAHLPFFSDRELKNLYLIFAAKQGHLLALQRNATKIVSVLDPCLPNIPSEGLRAPGDDL